MYSANLHTFKLVALVAGLASAGLVSAQTRVVPLRTAPAPVRVAAAPAPAPAPAAATTGSRTAVPISPTNPAPTPPRIPPSRS